MNAKDDIRQLRDIANSLEVLLHTPMSDARNGRIHKEITAINNAIKVYEAYADAPDLRLQHREHGVYTLSTDASPIYVDGTTVRKLAMRNNQTVRILPNDLYLLGVNPKA